MAGPLPVACWFSFLFWLQPSMISNHLDFHHKSPALLIYIYICKRVSHRISQRSPGLAHSARKCEIHGSFSVLSSLFLFFFYFNNVFVFLDSFPFWFEQYVVGVLLIWVSCEIEWDETVVINSFIFQFSCIKPIKLSSAWVLTMFSVVIWVKVFKFSAPWVCLLFW